MSIFFYYQSILCNRYLQKTPLFFALVIGDMAITAKSYATSILVIVCLTGIPASDLHRLMLLLQDQFRLVFQSNL